MITAKEAREIYEKALDSKLKEYDTKIREAANACKESIEIPGHLSKVLKEALEKEGYAVSESELKFGKPTATYISF